MGNHFSSNASAFKVTNHLKEHYGDMDLCTAVDNWEKMGCETITLQDGRQAHGVTPNGKPVFQFIPFNGFDQNGTVVAESDNCVAIIPAGCRDGSITHTMQPYRFDIGGLSALSSLIHLVVIPKKTSMYRIYNAVTLRKEHLPLIEEMERIGKNAVEILLNGSEEQIGSLRWILSQNGTVTKQDGSTHSTLVTEDDISEHSHCRKGFKTLKTMGVDHAMDHLRKSIVSSFHVGKNASVGWLHMHCRVSALDTVALDAMEAKAIQDGLGSKNTPVKDIVDLIHDGTFDKYYTDALISDESDDDCALVRTDTCIR